MLASIQNEMSGLLMSKLSPYVTACERDEVRKSLNVKVRTAEKTRIDHKDIAYTDRAK